MADDQWTARAEGALQAHFIGDDGVSRPGTDYAIGLIRGTETRRIIVRAFLADNISAATRADREYQGQTVLGYVFDRLAAGWTPADGDLPPLTIHDPKPGTTPGAPRRSLLSRLLGR
jgi:hypothetical protein